MIQVYYREKGNDLSVYWSLWFVRSKGCRAEL